VSPENQCGSLGNEAYFSKGQYSDAVTILGVRIYNDPPKEPILCNFGCGKLIDVIENVGHGMGCNKVSKQIIWHHNAIRDYTEVTIENIDPLIDIESEQILGQRMRLQ
jgi:hypothetical protein